MLFNNRPFVPPGCPNNSEGITPDLNELPFTLVLDTRTIVEGEATQAEIMGYFHEDDPDSEEDFNKLIDVSPLVVPHESNLVQKIGAILGAHPVLEKGADATSEANAKVDKIRKILVERVANCQGYRDGVCWALGGAVLQEAIEQVHECPDATAAE